MLWHHRGMGRQCLNEKTLVDVQINRLCD